LHGKTGETIGLVAFLKKEDDVKDGDAASIRHDTAVFALETWELGVGILIEQHESLWQPLQMYLPYKSSNSSSIAI